MQTLPIQLRTQSIEKEHFVLHSEQTVKKNEGLYFNGLAFSNIIMRISVAKKREISFRTFSLFFPLEKGEHEIVFRSLAGNLFIIEIDEKEAKRLILDEVPKSWFFRGFSTGDKLQLLGF